MNQNISCLGAIFHFGFNRWVENEDDYREPRFYLLTAIAFDDHHGWCYYFMPITSRLNNYITQLRIVNRPVVLANNPRYQVSFINCNRVFAVPFHLLGHCQPTNDFLNEFELSEAFNRSVWLSFNRRRRFKLLYLDETYFIWVLKLFIMMNYLCLKESRISSFLLWRKLSRVFFVYEVNLTLQLSLFLKNLKRSKISWNSLFQWQ